MGSLDSTARIPPASRPPPLPYAVQLTIKVETSPGGLENPPSHSRNLAKGDMPGVLVPPPPPEAGKEHATVSRDLQ